MDQAHIEDHIDDLLEQYLLLLHEYTSLREELTTLQTGMYQNIARANFSAERGVRFGQDYYDDRMQASSRLAISHKGQGQGQDQTQDWSGNQDRRSPAAATWGSGIVPSFAVINPATTVSIAEDPESHDRHPHPRPPTRSHPEAEDSAAQNAAKSSPTASSKVDVDAQPGKDTEATTTTTGGNTGIIISISPPAAKKSGVKAAPQRPNDPLRWFGLLTPAPLRHAQTQSLRAVEHVIPRLASVNAEMAAVEIEVRRARKRRAKAEAAAGRLAQLAGPEQERRPGMEAVTARDVCA
ncbi:hypothetical protein F5B17DRAFT_62074 [Nemania serpens]|nr:hypothetical protein F5B17DRAFT_62074 [Nemania serpens]